MFNCTNCHKVVGPRVSPVKVPLGFRAQSYENTFKDINRETVTKTTTGKEIMSEAALCTDCAGEAKTLISNRVQASPVSSKIEQEQAVAGRFSLATLSLAGLFKRKDHQTKRASADFYQAVSVLQAYEKRGGGL